LDTEHVRRYGHYTDVRLITRNLVIQTHLLRSKAAAYNCYYYESPFFIFVLKLSMNNINFTALLNDFKHLRTGFTVLEIFGLYDVIQMLLLLLLF